MTVADQLLARFVGLFARGEAIHQARYRRMVRAVVVGFFSKGLAALIGLLTVPLTISYLGPERYGIWMTISSLLIWLTVADAGVASGLTNALSGAYAQQRRDLEQRYVATAIWLLIGLAAIVGLGSTLLLRGLNLQRLLNLSTPAVAHEAYLALIVALAVFLFSLPLSLVYKILAAYQEGATANIWLGIANIVSLIALVLAAQLQASLAWLVFALAGTVALVALLSAIWLFVWHKPWLIPLPTQVDRASIRKIAGAGSLFFVAQIAWLLIFQTDNLIIVRYLGAEAVATYSVVWRLFTYATFFQVLIIPALWPAYTEAFTKRDSSWIQRTFRWHLLIAVVLALGLSLLFVVFSQPIIAVWAGTQVQPSRELILWMAGWTIIYAAMTTTACLLNASGHIRGQAIYGMTTAIVNIGLSIWWVQSYGVSGVIAATVTAYLICNVVPSLVETSLVLRRMSTGAYEPQTIPSATHDH
jgi:O-antigen/teichoic acid export membrane protein